MSQLVQDQARNHLKDQRNRYFTPQYADAKRQKEYLSPSGKYKLVVIPHRTSECSEYCQGLIYKAGKRSPVMEIQRDHHDFPHAWIESHVSGSDYLVCSEDYYGQTVIDLRALERVDYAPDVMASGLAFCWSDIHPSPDGRILAVEGGSWGSDFEIRFYEFDKPMESPLLPIGAQSGYDTFVRWMTPDQARYSIGARAHSWNRPSPLSALDWYIEYFSRWFDSGSSKMQIDTVNGALRLLSKLSESDQSKFRESFCGVVLRNLIQTTYFSDDSETKSVTRTFITTHESLMLQA